MYIRVYQRNGCPPPVPSLSHDATTAPPTPLRFDAEVAPDVEVGPGAGVWLLNTTDVWAGGSAVRLSTVTLRPGSWSWLSCPRLTVEGNLTADGPDTTVTLDSLTDVLSSDTVQLRSVRLFGGAARCLWCGWSLLRSPRPKSRGCVLLIVQGAHTVCQSACFFSSTYNIIVDGSSAISVEPWELDTTSSSVAVCVAGSGGNLMYVPCCSLVFCPS